MTPMPPEPCDSGDMPACPVPPLGWWDLRGQLDWSELAGIATVEVRLGGVL